MAGKSERKWEGKLEDGRARPGKDRTKPRTDEELKAVQEDRASSNNADRASSNNAKKVREDKKQQKSEGEQEQVPAGKLTVNEDFVRRRIAEALRNDGQSRYKIGLEILLLLPNDFVRNYEQLFHKALMVGDEGSRTGKMGDESGKTSVSAPGNKAGVMAVGAGGGAKRYRTYGFVANEQALELKQTVDRKLRVLSRDMDDFLTRKSEAELKNEAVLATTCGGCRQFVESSWKFCPQCGYNQAS